MSQKLFVLGLPGSGKSTVSRYIINYLNRYYDSWFATRICDYDILYEMFEEDKAQKHFYSTEHGGFYVKTPTKYDAALKKLEVEINKGNFVDNTIILIEFARNDYLQAFNNFEPDFLRDAYFLFLDVDIEIGMRRVRDRVKHRQSSDDHFVSKYTFEFYRQKDNAKYLSSVAKQLTIKFGIDPQHLKIVDNRSSERSFWEPVNSIVKLILANAALLV